MIVKREGYIMNNILTNLDELNKIFRFLYVKEINLYCKGETEKSSIIVII